jgi:hypothetical protein
MIKSSFGHLTKFLFLVMAAILDGGRGYWTYLKMIQAKFALNWLSGFRGEDF